MNTSCLGKENNIVFYREKTDRSSENETVHNIEAAAKSREKAGRVLHITQPLEKRLHQIAQLGGHTQNNSQQNTERDGEDPAQTEEDR